MFYGRELLLTQAGFGFLKLLLLLLLLLSSSSSALAGKYSPILGFSNQQD
jgi:hypothetical protein